MKKHFLLISSLLACTLSLADTKVVYRLSEGIPQASKAMGNVRNHLAADSTVKIVVAAHGFVVDFLPDGATNQMDQPFAGGVSDLVNKGVEFRVCNNTLVSCKISADKLLMVAKVVPAGESEVAYVQAKEVFDYLRP